MSFSRFESSVTTVGFYLDNYEKILTDGITLKIFFQTVELSLMITLIPSFRFAFEFHAQV